MEELSKIRRMRAKLGITQKELARQSGVSQSLIAKIEAGRLDPAYSNAMRILDALHSMDHSLRAEDVMNRSIISVGPGQTLKQAIARMKKHCISQMPVVEDRKAVGLVSESVILDSIMGGKKPEDMVKSVMRDAPPTVTRSASLSLVSQLLKEYPIVLITENGTLRGHITKSDIITKAF